MNKNEFCQRVSKELVGLTKEERKAVEKEISNHIEDAFYDLLAAGYDEATANELAINAMGSPEEIGKEMQKAYSSFWHIVLKLSRVGIVFALIIIFVVAFQDFNENSSRISSYKYIWNSRIEIDETIELEGAKINLAAIRNYEPFDDCEPELIMYIDCQNSELSEENIKTFYSSDAKPKTQLEQGFLGHYALDISKSDEKVIFYFEVPDKNIYKSYTVELREAIK